MVRNLQISNFKSIYDLSIECKKLNVFIGEPNSGKSNIIEALALKSQNAITDFLNKDIFRYKSISDLFYDFNIAIPIEVHFYDEILKIEKPNNVFLIHLIFFILKKAKQLKLIFQVK